MNEETKERMPKRVSMFFRDEDFTKADALKPLIDRPTTRTDVIRRSLSLLYWAFVTKEATELVVMKKGKEVGRMRWTDAPGS